MTPSKTSAKSSPANHPLAQQLPLVSGRWLGWSLAAIFGGGPALVYLTLCLLFWQGQWQILYHPSHSVVRTPLTDGVAFADIHFGTTEAGKVRLDGWLIPGEKDGPYSDLTVLYLHGMSDGSLAETLPDLLPLHESGMNIFAFDYRGFGRSEDLHPSEASVTEDTDAAWEYLVSTGHIAGSSIVMYGKGLGAAMAADAVLHHPDAAALVLADPVPTAVELLSTDPRSRWLPVRLLAHDTYDPRPALGVVRQPKLFLVPPSSAAAGKKYAAASLDPKLIVYLPASDAGQQKTAALRRFLDELPKQR